MIVTVLISIAFIVIPTTAEEPQDTIEYIAFGDSIAKGYTCDKSELVPYPELVRGQLESHHKTTTMLTNTAKNGISTIKLNNKILADEAVIAKIRTADVITLTIGSNDLMDEFKKVCQEIIGRNEKFQDLDDAIQMLDVEMKEHPSLIFKAISALSSWDYDTFEENYQVTMEIITQNKKPSAQIVVTNLYNPVKSLGLPGTMNTVVDGIISAMNNIIDRHTQEYEYQVVDLFHSDITNYVQADGLHPNQEGQQFIADAVCKALASQETEETMQGSVTASTVPVKGKEEVQKANEIKQLLKWAIICAVTSVLLLVIIQRLEQKKGKYHIDEKKK